MSSIEYKVDFWSVMNPGQIVFWYLSPKFARDHLKITNFWFQNSIFSFKNQFEPSKNDFVFWICKQEKTYIFNIFYFVHFWKTLFSKNGPNFWELSGKFVWQISKNYLTRIHQWSKIYRNYWNRSRPCIILDSKIPRLVLEVFQKV